MSRDDITPAERPAGALTEVRALRERLRHVELVAYVALAISGGLLGGVLVAIAGGILRL